MLDSSKPNYIKISIVDQFYREPRKLFIVDGIGAVLSACLLGVVLVHFQKHIGIPVNTLYLLAVIPCFFALLDVLFYNQRVDKTHRNLLIIATCNIAYCVLSASLGFYHGESITIIGFAYLAIEILIVMILAALQVKVSKSL